MKNHERTEQNDSTETRDLLFALGGAALVLFGAGLMMSHPLVRRYVGELGLNNLVSTAVPDVERYLKLRSM
jgi:hypothetical protein